jgi:hypothetical protein
MKPNDLTCNKCRKAIEGPAVAAANAGGLVLFCSFDCKKAFTAAARIRRLTDDRQARNRPPRKQTQAEIRRQLERASIPSENEISGSAADVLDERGVYHTRIQSGSIQTAGGHYMKLARIGTPDRMFADGLIVFLEIKKPGEIPGPEQRETIADLRRNGALAFVVDDYGQTEFITAALDRRRERIDAIAAAIAELQSDIDSEFNNRYGKKN